MSQLCSDSTGADFIWVEICDVLLLAHYVGVLCCDRLEAEESVKGDGMGGIWEGVQSM